MYQYTDVKLSLLTVNLPHIRCRCTTSLGTVEDIDAFIRKRRCTDFFKNVEVL